MQYSAPRSGSMNSINLPAVFEDRLRMDPALYGSVLRVISHYASLVESSNVPFFRQYTDHGCKHISDVIQTCGDLISPESWGLMTSADVAILVMGVVLHDIALHFQEGSFQELILQEGASRAILNTDVGSWYDLWVDFISEISRFDRRKLHSLFGVNEPIEVPDLRDSGSWTVVQKDLIGEFLRRHHPRLAHEVALLGIPLVVGSDLGSFGVPYDFSDLAGLVARSHGVDIRECLVGLEKDYHPRDYKGAHVVYLMTLIRVADYIQIQEERAPQHLIRAKTLRSPVSRREWQIHGAIRNISTFEPDPEQLRIQVIPENLRLESLLRLKEWLVGIQNELDVSWAVIGEVYGRYYSEPGRLFKLRLRRVKSDVDDLSEIGKKIPYVPKRIKFSSADAELLKLLISPLYGNRVEIGVRELLQNSLDAVREARFLSGERPSREVEFGDQEADVVIDVNFKELKFKICDKGVGMTVETIESYFLKAGASFRNSDLWKQSFSCHEKGSKVLRTGRFGVGALAAFLIGDKIKVQTRHINSEIGYKFEASLEDESILIEYVSCPVGTLIEIPLSPEAGKSLYEEGYRAEYATSKWDWYSLVDPILLRRVTSSDGEEVAIEQEEKFPQMHGDLSCSGWRSVSCEGFDEVQWSYDMEFHKFSCNGIDIRGVRRSGYSSGEWLQPFAYPTISVFDANGNLPLTLARDNLAVDMGDLPFDGPLRQSVINDFLCSCIQGAPNDRAGVKSQFESLNFNGLTREMYWLWLKSGVTLLDPFLLGELGISSVFFVDLGKREYRKVAKLLQGFPTVRSDMAGRNHLYGDRFKDYFYNWDCAEVFDDIVAFKGARYLVSNLLVEKYLVPRGFNRDYRSQVKVRRFDAFWSFLEIGEVGDLVGNPMIEIAAMMQYETHDQFVCCSERFVDHVEMKDGRSMLAESWLRFFGKGYLAYSSEERMLLLESSALELKSYMREGVSRVNANHSN